MRRPWNPPGMRSILVIGDMGDSHLAAVVARVEELGRVAPVVIDAPSLARSPYSLIDLKLTIQGTTIDLGDGGAGWLRRYAPSMWGAGLVEGSLDAARKRSLLTLVGSITRLGARRWLTTLECMLRAEDRLVQLEIAARAGHAVPRSIVTSDASIARAALGDHFVVKPMTIGYFNTDDGPRAVFATILHADELDSLDFADAPFVAQETIHARHHLRVVTVSDRAWVTSIDACGRPLDWRRQESAHSSWTPTPDPEAAASALSMARAFGIGYSSQDWIRDELGRLVFLDLNPGGQWMFLPQEVSDEITTAIALMLTAS